MKRSVMAVAVVLTMVIMGFAGSAMAAPIIAGYSGYGASGVGLYGLAWSWNNNGAGGNSAWGTPGLLDGELTWTGPTTEDFAFIIGTAFGVPAGVNIDFTPTPGGNPFGSFLTTRSSNTTAGVLWTEVAVSPDEIEFFAPNPGADLVA